MAVQFRNREDTRRYAAAEDAYTSEGGYLPLENALLGKDADAVRENRELPHDFMETVNRYATGMRHVLTVFRGGSAYPAARPAIHQPDMPRT